MGLFGGEEVGWGRELQVFKAISVKTLADHEVKDQTLQRSQTTKIQK